MNTDDNFDSLWSSLKEQVKAARGDRDGINTDGSDWSQDGYGGRVRVGDADEDGATLHIGTRTANVNVNCQPADLRAIAAQCLAAAEEIEEAIAEAQSVRPSPSPADHLTIRKTSEAHAHLLTAEKQAR